MFFVEDYRYPFFENMNTQKTWIRKHILILITGLLLASCANVRVVSKYDSDIPTPHKVSKTAFFWGLQQPKDILTEGSCASICMVTAKTNFTSVLVSAITLGIVIPVQMEYACCPYEPDPGKI